MKRLLFRQHFLFFITIRLCLFLLLTIHSALAAINSHPQVTPLSSMEICQKEIRALPHGDHVRHASEICAKAQVLSKCQSVKGEPIFHIDHTNNSEGRRILVFSLIHGDEEASGAVSVSWLSRLAEFEPRNNWRVIPILNPDGWHAHTRTNARGVDVNRNFPSQDWGEMALAYWKKNEKSNTRRYPGPQASSEPETQCAIAHIDDFKPNFIISIHTPLGLLDFDGPKVQVPRFNPLPWVSLGNFPGSLGRYMWIDRNVPVMTVELKAGPLAARQLEEFDRLQDISGTIALQAEKILKAETQRQPTSPKRSGASSATNNSTSGDKNLASTQRDSKSS